jgi:hypothetical protein
VPSVIAGLIDVLPAKRVDVPKQGRIELTRFCHLLCCAFQVHGIPERDGSHNQVEPAHAMPLILRGGGEAAAKVAFLWKGRMLGDQHRPGDWLLYLGSRSIEGPVGLAIVVFPVLFCGGHVVDQCHRQPSHAGNVWGLSSNPFASSITWPIEDKRVT